jgi:SAM-dependent methyltransferase
LNLNYYRQRSREYFDRTVTADAAAILQPVVDLAPPPARVRDVGCGSGRDLAWFREKVYMGFSVSKPPRNWSPGRESTAVVSS